MIVQRDEFYFEPRCIDLTGKIRWYGEVYIQKELLAHTLETVYIRDNGRELYVYSLDSDEWQQERRIKALFTLICRIKKYNDKGRYGKRIR